VNNLLKIMDGWVIQSLQLNRQMNMLVVQILDATRRKSSPNWHKLIQFPKWYNTNWCNFQRDITQIDTKFSEHWCVNLVFKNNHIVTQFQKIHHCEHSIRIHVRICKHNVRILIRNWNALSLFFSCNWLVSLTYLLLNFIFLWICIRILYCI
jgi:hypothetical protein